MGLLDLFFKKNTPVMNDPNFTASMQFYTPGQPVNMPKNYGAFVREGYRKNPTVYACINKIASAAAGISWKLYKDESMKKEITSHPLLDLWKNPNPGMRGASPLIEAVFGFWLMSGNSYLWAFKDSKGQPLALWPLRPDRMKAVVGINTIENWIYGYGSENPQIYEIEDIAHIKFPAYDDDIYGLSPIEVASFYVDQINESMGWNTALMQNMGRPASVFMSKNYLTTEQRNQVKEELRRKYSGKRNAGMPLVLEADMTWQNMSLKPAEMDWLQSREHNTRDIAAIFDIAPELIGDAAGKTFANVSEARQALYLENVLPKLDRFRAYMNSWLLPMYEDLDNAFFTYDVNDIEALKSIFQQALDDAKQQALDQWNDGTITLNEYRDAVGLDPIGNGDCFKFGAVLVSVDSLKDYADQSLQAPAAPPMALPEPLNVANPQQQQSNDTQKILVDLIVKMYDQHYKNHDFIDNDASKPQGLLQESKYHIRQLEFPQDESLNTPLVASSITDSSTPLRKASKNDYREFYDRYQ